MAEGQLSPAPASRGQWNYVFGPREYFVGHELRGSYHLVIDPADLDSKWEKVKHLTINGELGYRSSISPGPMSYGCERLVGKYIICVQCRHSRKEEMRQILENFELFSLVFKYDLIQQFKPHYNCLEYFNEYEKLYEDKTPMPN